MDTEAIKQFLNDVHQRHKDYDYTKVKSVLQELKRGFVATNKQDEAKEVWCYEQTINAQKNFMEAYKALKQEKFYEAWCILEKCEIALLYLKPHFYQRFSEYSLDFIENHARMLQSLYPYKLFISPEMLIHHYKCSICDQRVVLRNPCRHEVGEIYNGEMCVRIIDGIEFLGSAFVTNPVQKYSVPFLTDQQTGKTVDPYNYNLVKFLIEKLSTPFDDWSLKWTKKLHPHSKFKHLSRNDKCPCASGKKYKQCCLNKKGVLMDHCIFSIPGIEGCEERIL
ncbi:MAG: SEC-C domain-containing protein [Candidatus Omnitrophica bacterium]|nr:SEC-C domain-containing protein [Candidatus Omnitrophota bacterium]